MTSAKLKQFCEEQGFGIAHARRTSHRFANHIEYRAYVAVRSESRPLVDEIRWHSDRPDAVALYHHAIKPNGYTQFDKFLGHIML